MFDLLCLRVKSRLCLTCRRKGSVSQSGNCKLWVRVIMQMKCSAGNDQRKNVSMEKSHFNVRLSLKTFPAEHVWPFLSFQVALQTNPQLGGAFYSETWWEYALIIDAQNIWNWYKEWFSGACFLFFVFLLFFFTSNYHLLLLGFGICFHSSANG